MGTRERRVMRQERSRTIDHGLHEQNDCVPSGGSVRRGWDSFPLGLARVNLVQFGSVWLSSVRFRTLTPVQFWPIRFRSRYLSFTASSTSEPCRGRAVLPPLHPAATAFRATGTPLLNSTRDRSCRVRSDGLVRRTPWTVARAGTITGASTYRNHDTIY